MMQIKRRIWNGSGITYLIVATTIVQSQLCSFVGADRAGSGLTDCLVMPLPYRERRLKAEVGGQRDGDSDTYFPGDRSTTICRLDGGGRGKKEGSCDFRQFSRKATSRSKLDSRRRRQRAD